MTTKIELGTTVMLLPLQHALDTARIVGTVDHFARGRLTAFGVGLGWAQGEFDALGVPFDRRAAITDDGLAALRAWSSDLAAHEGAYARFSGVRTAPRPSSTTAIWVGGVADAALRRAVRHGDAWHPISLTVESLAERLERLRAIAADEGRPVPALAPRIPLRITERPPEGDRVPGEGTLDQIRGDVAALEALGAADVVFDPFVPRPHGHAARLKEIEQAAAKVIELR
jgi:alkanesulfonate monooxygenase SsuD/methylene tetrahydromethanopterin reductase-like flavin-dependent oxidoreductase (luciferase family)